MTVFYRYIRPVKFNEVRAELETLPRGGICLRLDDLGGALSFSYARCHDDELFSKDVAKRIADNRARSWQNLEMLIEPSKNPKLLAERVIEAAEAWRAPIDSRWYVAGQYVEIELRALAHNLEALMISNAREEAKALIWKAGVEAIDTAARYREYDNSSRKVAGDYD